MVSGYCEFLKLVSDLSTVMELAVLLAAGLEDWVDFGVIIGILCLNAAVGWYQEKQAADVVASLKGDIALRAQVIRDSVQQECLARELVPGDVASHLLIKTMSNANHASRSLSEKVRWYLLILASSVISRIPMAGKSSTSLRSKACLAEAQILTMKMILPKVRKTTLVTGRPKKQTVMTKMAEKSRQPSLAGAAIQSWRVITLPLQANPLLWIDIWEI